MPSTVCFLSSPHTAITTAHPCRRFGAIGGSCKSRKGGLASREMARKVMLFPRVSASPMAELCGMLRAPPAPGTEEVRRTKNGLFQEEIEIKEPDFLSINLFKTQVLSFQHCSYSEQFPGIIRGLSKMLPSSFGWRCWGLGNYPCHLPCLSVQQLSWLGLLVKPWECRSGSRLSIHKWSLTFWETPVPKVPLKEHEVLVKKPWLTF